MNKKRLRVAKKSPMFEKKVVLGYVSSRWVLHQSVLQQLFDIRNWPISSSRGSSNSLYGNNSSINTDQTSDV